MKTIKIKIDIPPFGKQRARSGRAGKFYTPAPTRDYESLIAYEYQMATNEFADNIPLDILVVAAYEIPKSYNKNKLDLIVSGKLIPTKHDFDNILKIVCDGLNKVAYNDDKWVVFSKIVKIFTPNENFIEIVIREAENYYKIFNTNRELFYSKEKYTFLT